MAYIKMKYLIICFLKKYVIKYVFMVLVDKIVVILFFIILICKVVRFLSETQENYGKSIPILAFKTEKCT